MELKTYTAASGRKNLTSIELNEEIDFFRDYCGWSDRRIEQYLGLADQTLMQRKHRAEKAKRDAGV